LMICIAFNVFGFPSSSSLGIGSLFDNVACEWGEGRAIQRNVAEV
jgi:hypothetical protein